MVMVDLQIGLFHLVRDQSSVEYRNAILGYSALGQLFKLPTVITSSGETGPNGPFPKEILAMHPTAAFIRRPGEVNAWDNEEFRKVVEKTGKKQILVAGITTDVSKDSACPCWLNARRDIPTSGWVNTVLIVTCAISTGLYGVFGPFSARCRI